METVVVLLYNCLKTIVGFNGIEAPIMQKL